MDPTATRPGAWVIASVAMHLAIAVLLAGRTLESSAVAATAEPMQVQLVARAAPRPVPAPPVVAAPPPPETRPAPEPAPPPKLRARRSAPKPAPRPVPRVEPAPPPVEVSEAPVPEEPTPLEPSEPLDSAESTDATEPVDSTEPAEPTLPAEAVQVAAVAPSIPAPSPDQIRDEIAAYAARVRAQVAERKKYPRRARRRGMEGLVYARIEIGPWGEIVSLELEAGAPALLARAARAAVESAAPFPPPPPALSSALRLPIRYSLADPD